MGGRGRGRAIGRKKKREEKKGEEKRNRRIVWFGLVGDASLIVSGSTCMANPNCFVYK